MVQCQISKRTVTGLLRSETRFGWLKTCEPPNTTMELKCTMVMKHLNGRTRKVAIAGMTAIKDPTKPLMVPYITGLL